MPVLAGFSMIKLAVIGVVLAGLIAGGVTVYLSIKKIGAQETVISVQQSTIENLNRTLVRERLQHENNKKIASNERQNLQKKIIELHNAPNDCLDAPISKLFNGEYHSDNSKPIH